MRSFFIVIALGRLLLVNSFGCFAQSWPQMVAHLKQTYSQSQQFHLTMRIQAFEKEGSQQPFLTQQVELLRNQNNYFYKISQQEMLINDQLFLMVNQATRELIIQPRTKKEENKLTKQWMPNLDSLMANSPEPRFVEEREQLQHYRFLPAKGPIRQMDLYFSSQDTLIKKMIYRYQNGRFTRIEFTKFELHPAFDPDTFDEKRYVTKVKGKYRGVGRFANHQVSQ